MKTKKNKLTYSSLSLGLNNIVNFILGRFVGECYGWGLGALGIIQAFGKPSSFDRAIDQAYPFSP